MRAAVAESEATTSIALIDPAGSNGRGSDDPINDPNTAEWHMARKRKRRGAGRVTRPGPGSGPGTGERSADRLTEAELASLVIEAADCVEVCRSHDMCATEVQVACTIGICVSSAWSPDGVTSSQALTHARKVGGSPGAVVAAGIAAYGNPAYRKRAQRLLAAFAEEGVDIPDWVVSLGVAEPLQAVKIRDEWDEHCTLVVDFAKPDGSTHALWASLHPYCWGMAYDFAVRPAGEAHDRVLDPGHVLEPISLEHARSLLARSLSEFDTALLEADDVEFDHLGHDADLRPLVGQRLELLPQRNGPEDEAGIDAEAVAGRAADIVKDFLAEPCPLGEREDDVTNLVLAMLVFSGACHDNDMTHWTPPRVAWFIEKFLPMCWSTGENAQEETDEQESSRFDPSDEWLATADSAFPRWLRLTADRRGDDNELLEANLDAARISMRTLRREITGSPLPVVLGPPQWN